MTAPMRTALDGAVERLPRLATAPIADPRAVVQGDGFRITVLTEGLLRLEQSADDRFEDRASSFAITRRLPVPDFRVIETDGVLQIVTDRLRLTYDRAEFSPSGLTVEVLGGLTPFHSVWRFGDPIESLGGTARTLDEADGAVPLEPGVTSRRDFSLIDDSASFVFTDDGRVEPRSGGGHDLYLFGYGRDHAAAVRALYAVSGAPPLLPRWALGNWWSRYHPYSDEEYQDLIERFAAEGLPFSIAVLDMDWHVTDVDPRLGSGWTGYTWNRDLFPDPEAFLARMRQCGLRVTLNVHPADGVRPHEEAYPDMAEALGRDPASADPIAFDLTDPAFVSAYLGLLHRRIEEQGVDFWWLDWQSGPHSRVAGLDPLWLLNHFHFVDNARDGRRPLILSRYAGPGSHRYPVGFSGDTVVSWASLAFQPIFTASAADIGYGWWSHDIGGHLHGRKDDELATRWVQLGCFSPVLRLHSQANPFMTKEPWAFGPHARAVQTRFLRLRQRMVPYLHSMNHRAARDGAPLVVPLYHRWPDAEAAYEHPAQYLFGDALMVAPITEPADPSSATAAVRAWLPPGTWVDVLTGLAYDGDRHLVLHRGLDTIPVLAPAGAVIALDADEVPANDPVAPVGVELLVVVGADGEHVLLEDDGAGTGARLASTPLRWRQQAGELLVGPTIGAVDTVPATRDWTAAFLALDPDASLSVTVDGAPVTAAVSREEARTVVRVGDVASTARLILALGPDPRHAPNDVPERVHALLDAAPCSYELKARLLRLVSETRPVTLLVSDLMATDMPEAVRDALLEVVLATTPRGARG